MNPGYTTTPEAAAPAHDGERELKFTILNARVAVARAWLDELCDRDPEYPAAVVWTMYYDTPGLASLGEKINSDYLKRKVRVRWYSDLGGRPSGPAFIEAKFRIGNRRMKARTRLQQSAEEISRWGLQDPRLRDFPQALREEAIAIADAWQPVMLIRYRRDRFIERFSRSRISLDSDIAGVAVNPSALSAPDYTPIAASVVEIKGLSEDMPQAVRPLLQLGVRKGSFSKFLAVFAHMSRHTF